MSACDAESELDTGRNLTWPAATQLHAMEVNTGAHTPMIPLHHRLLTYRVVFSCLNYLISLCLGEIYDKNELDEYRQLFDMFDTDGSGAIGNDELKKAILNFGHQATDAEIDKLIEEVCL